MDCRTFWQSNPKRLKQFLDGREKHQEMDLQAWATGYYTARAFAGKFPRKPDLFSKKKEDRVEADGNPPVSVMIDRWKKWAAVQQARLIDKEIEEARANGRLQQAD